MWLWWVTEALDLAASLRAAAACLSAAGKADGAMRCLERADRVTADGTLEAAAPGVIDQGSAKAAYKEITGLDVDDPEVKAKLAGAAAAMARAERARADAAALAAQEAKARTDKARARLRRRGRRDP